jgi:putative transposase
MAQMKSRKGGVVVKLTSKDRKQVLFLIGKGKESGRVVKRALVLKLMDQGMASPQAAQTLGMTAMSARNIAKNYGRNGLEAALHDRPRTGQPRRMKPKVVSQIVAMVCASPPEGFARWSVRLIAEAAVKKKLVKKTNRESIRLILKNHELKPWLKKNVVHGGVDA